jgi:hypothetical protein
MKPRSYQRWHAATGRLHRALATGVLALALPAGVAAQDANFVIPILDIEEHLRDLPFEILDWQGSRAPGDRTQHVILGFDDDSVLRVKWANAEPGASTFNNQPRYEAAAYEIQKLFLEPDEYVVPPTVLRAFPIDYVDARIPGTRRTFRNAESVLVALQYWLSYVTPENFWDPARAAEDTLYARHIGNMNLLTYLIRHNDANVGNFLISESAENPRVFSVDNGVAFRAPESDRGHEWRELQVRRLPRASIERLRALSEDDLHGALGVIAEYRIENGQLLPVPPGENLSPGRGVRQQDERVQLGLTSLEIRQIEQRRRTLLRNVDRGRIEIF